MSITTYGKARPRRPSHSFCSFPGLPQQLPRRHLDLTPPTAAAAAAAAPTPAPHAASAPRALATLALRLVRLVGLLLRVLLVLTDWHRGRGA